MSDETAATIAVASRYVPERFTNFMTLSLKRVATTPMSEMMMTATKGVPPRFTRAHIAGKMRLLLSANTLRDIAATTVFKVVQDAATAASAMKPENHDGNAVAAAALTGASTPSSAGERSAT